MVYVALVLFTLVVVALGAWANRRPSHTAPMLPCSAERLGIREPHLPYGPPSPH